jgi:hypothetical protein
MMRRLGHDQRIKRVPELLEKVNVRHKAVRENLHQRDIIPEIPGIPEAPVGAEKMRVGVRVLEVQMHHLPHRRIKPQKLWNRREPRNE